MKGVKERKGEEEEGKRNEWSVSQGREWGKKSRTKKLPWREREHTALLKEMFRKKKKKTSEN